MHLALSSEGVKHIKLRLFGYGDLGLGILGNNVRILSQLLSQHPHVWH
jgi:hypothetical protein